MLRDPHTQEPVLLLLSIMCPSNRVECWVSHVAVVGCAPAAAHGAARPPLGCWRAPAAAVTPQDPTAGALLLELLLCMCACCTPIPRHWPSMLGAPILVSACCACWEHCSHPCRRRLARCACSLRLCVGSATLRRCFWWQRRCCSVLHSVCSCHDDGDDDYCVCISLLVPPMHNLMMIIVVTFQLCFLFSLDDMEQNTTCVVG